jgi:hypothetical protein
MFNSIILRVLIAGSKITDPDVGVGVGDGVGGLGPMLIAGNVFLGEGCGQKWKWAGLHRIPRPGDQVPMLLNFFSCLSPMKRPNKPKY